MAAYIPFVYVCSDALCCMGLGLMIAFVHQMGTGLLGRHTWSYFLVDAASFWLAAVLLYGFAAGRSYSGLVRWYMVAGMLVGVAAYQQMISSVIDWVWQCLHWVLIGPIFWLASHLGRQICTPVRRVWSARQIKVKQKRTNRRRKRLQKSSRVLYNSNQ